MIQHSKKNITKCKTDFGIFEAYMSSYTAVYIFQNTFTGTQLQQKEEGKKIGFIQLKKIILEKIYLSFCFESVKMLFNS